MWRWKGGGLGMEKVEAMETAAGRGGRGERVGDGAAVMQRYDVILKTIMYCRLRDNGDKSRIHDHLCIKNYTLPNIT